MTSLFCGCSRTEQKADRIALTFTVLTVALSFMIALYAKSYALSTAGMGAVASSGVEVSLVTLSDDRDVLKEENDTETTNSQTKINKEQNKLTEHTKDVIPVKKAVAQPVKNTQKTFKKKVLKKVSSHKPTKKKSLPVHKSELTSNHQNAENTQKESSDTLSDRSLNTKGKSVNPSLNGNSEAATYNLLIAKLNELKRYPTRAIRQSKEGQCIILLKVSKGGIVESGRIDKSSSHLILDAECKRLIEKITGFDTKEHALSRYVTVPVTFSLKD